MTVLGLFAILLGVLGLVVVHRTPKLVRSPGKPLAEPRVLSYLDAWQTVVFNAGDTADDIRSRLFATFQDGSADRFTCATERIWYWGLEGKTERDQMVLRYNRGIVFCQVHRYGSDLYVGWDAHLNLGAWTEKVLRSGVDKETGKRIRLMTVERAVQSSNEYDLVDLNCLLEWTHARLSNVLRNYLKEREIDQEIDFAIIRGSRQDATARSEKEPSRKRLFRKA